VKYDSRLSAFRAKAAAWLRDEKPKSLPADFTEKFHALRAWQLKLHGAGWLGLGWPAEFGGGGLTAAEQLAFNEELVAARAPMPAGVVGLEVVGPAILELGTDDQRRRYLPPLLSGEEIWCQGFSEPDAGSDLASLRTRADSFGDELVVNGTKVWTTHGQFADWCALLARTDPDAPKHKGISYLLVPMDAPGVAVRPIQLLNGDPEFAEVIFEDVRVPRHNLLGPLNAGWAAAMTTLAYERGQYIIRRTAELRLDLTDLVAELGDILRADVRHVRRLGQVELTLAALNARCGVILDGLIAGRTGPEGSVDKLLLAEVEHQLFGLAFDLAGPFRMHRSDALSGERWAHDWMFGLAAAIYGGTAEIQRGILAERVLGLPRSA
jgi:alkylation response protein AidB-like acyl-CoA dehydrogenase